MKDEKDDTRYERTGVLYISVLEMTFNDLYVEPSSSLCTDNTIVR
jgi:hypothetical protein